MPEHKRGSGLKRVLLLLLIGPALVAVLAIVGFCVYRSREPFSAFFAVCGGAWGLTVGILRRSLRSSLIGLNLGAFLGFIFFRTIDVNNFSIPVSIALLLFFGAILGAGLNIDRRISLRSLSSGALAGAASFLTMGLLGCVQIPILDRLPSAVLDNSAVLHWCLFPAVSFLPLTGGLAVLLWLFVDVLPKLHLPDDSTLLAESAQPIS